MNLRTFVWLYIFLCVGLGGAYANDSKNNDIFQVIKEVILKILENLIKWLTDKQGISSTTLQGISSTTLKPMQNSSSSEDPYSYNNFRLLDATIPFNYNLTIKAFYNLNSAKEENFYEGHIQIKFRQENPNKMIIFHLDPSLQIQKQISITSLLSDFKPKIVITRSLDYQLYQIVFDQELPKDQYLMEIYFKGDYGSENNLVGFHKVNYNENGLLKTMLATKFQPADARKAFPCFDEPSFKATFDITVEHPLDTIALGNWPEISSEIFSENNQIRKRTKFDTTYKMSTYLAAWFIGPLDYISKSISSNNNITIKVWGTKTNIEHGYLDFALESAKKSLDFLEHDYMNSSAPIPPKLDILSIPRTQSGASENWGLINLRENLILYSNLSTKLEQKRATALTLAHEISHSWFGNYLTVKFWEDAWLKEAMSNYLAYITIQNTYPEFDQMRQYISLVKVPIMMEDSYSTTLPVATKSFNLTPNQILDMFTTITYEKGVSLLIMLERIIGEENLKLSLRNFIHKFRFGVADANLFYESIKLPSEFKEISTKSFIENWLYQKNFPEIKVRLSYSNDRAKVNFEQTRFLFNPLNETEQEDFPSEYNNEWIIYLKCRVGGNIKQGHLNGDSKEFRFVLNQKRDTFELDREYSWIKCNSDFEGYFLVNYDEENFEAFNQILSHNYSAFSAEDRAEIVHELFYFALKGDTSYGKIKGTSELIVKNENTSVTWSVLIWNLKKLLLLSEYRPSFKNLSDYLVPLLMTRYNINELFADSEVHSISLIKSEIMDLICRLESDQCIRKAFERFNSIPEEYFLLPEFNSNSNTLKQNQRAIIYKYVVKNSPNKETWYSILSLYYNSVMPSERENALNGLASSTRIWQLETLYEEAFKQNSRIRNEDFYPLITLIGQNSAGRDFIWKKFRKDFNKIGSKFGYSIFLILALKDVTQNFENELMLNELITNFPLNGSPFSLYIRHIRKYIIQNIFWTENLEKKFLDAINIK